MKGRMIEKRKEREEYPGKSWPFIGGAPIAFNNSPPTPLSSKSNKIEVRKYLIFQSFHFLINLLNYLQM